MKKLKYLSDWSAHHTERLADGQVELRKTIYPSSDDVERQTARQRLRLFEKRVKRAQKAARKYGFPEPSYEFEKPKFVHDLETGGSYETIDVTLRATLDFRFGEYELAAILHHDALEGEKNLIEFFPKYVDGIPPRFASAPPHCEECGWDRNRKSTVVLHQETDGSFAQYGSACFAKPMFGAAGGNLASLLRFFRRIVELVEDEETYTRPKIRISEGVDTLRFFSYIAREIRLKGYRPGETYHVARSAMNQDQADAKADRARQFEPIPKDRETAKLALSWGANLELEDELPERLLNWRQNARALCAGAFLPFTRNEKNLDFATRVVNAFLKFQRAELRIEAQDVSSYFLKKGDVFGQGPNPAIAVRVESIYTKRSQYRNHWASRNPWSIVRFRTLDGGNTVVWKGTDVTNEVGRLQLAEGQRIWISGKVVSLDSYRGEPQTTIVDVGLLRPYTDDERPLAATERTRTADNPEPREQGGSERAAMYDLDEAPTITNDDAPWSERGAMLELPE